MKILMITDLNNECIQEDLWIAESFMKDNHIVKLVNKHYDKSLDDEYDIFIKRYSWSDDMSDFSIGAEESDYETRILTKDLPRINFDGKFDNQGKHYLADLYKLGYQVVPTIKDINDITKLRQYQKFLVKPVNGYAGYGIIEANRDNVEMFWNKNFVIQPKLDFDSEVQFYFVGNKLEFSQIFTPKKLLSHDNAIFYNPNGDEIKLAETFATLNGPNFNGVQRIDFLKIGNQLLLSELEDDSPYMAIEALSLSQREQFIDDFKQMVYQYYDKFKKERGITRSLKR